jgi:hypothetical protein
VKNGWPRVPGLIITIAIVYLLLAAAGGQSLAPWCDEGWFSDPAMHFIKAGVMSNTALDPTAEWREVKLTGIDRHTYWVMPLYVISLVPWYRIAGFGLAQLRWFSAMWGLVLLFAWYRIVTNLLRDRAIAVALLALLAVDYNVIFAASAGRMDMMAVALGSLGVAMYLDRREHSAAQALFFGSALTAAACLTHPNAIFFVADVIFLAVYLDRSRLLRWRCAIAYAAPYCVALAGWGLYIAEDQALFKAQFLGNAGAGSGRFAAILHPFESLRDEVVNRYLANFGGAPFSSGAARLKLVVLLAYFLGAAAFFLLPKLRARPGHRALAGMFLIHVGMLAVIDGYKQTFYMIYVEPLWIAAAAAAAVHGWRAMGRRRWIVAAALGAVVCIHVSVTAFHYRGNPYRNGFLPAARFVRSRPASAVSVMASSEMGFELGFTPALTDDFRLGYRSGKRAELIVVDAARYRSWIDGLKDQDPENYRYIETMLSRDYTVAYDRAGYRVYERKHSGE